MLSYRKTVSARHLDGMNISVTFDNGTCGVFDFTPYVDYPCYHKLRDPEFFALVRAEHGTLMWPGEIDISPETVWEQARSKSSPQR